MPDTSKVTTLYDVETESYGELQEAAPQMGQGPATKIAPGSLDERNNAHGFTHPDLHRVIDPSDPQYLTDAELEEISPHELEPRKYSVGIYGYDSYRTTRRVVHTDQEHIVARGDAYKPPMWSDHVNEEDAALGGSYAKWHSYPLAPNPVSRGTPDEIP